MCASNFWFAMLKEMYRTRSNHRKYFQVKKYFPILYYQNLFRWWILLAQFCNYWQIHLTSLTLWYFWYSYIASVLKSTPKTNMNKVMNYMESSFCVTCERLCRFAPTSEFNQSFVRGKTCLEVTLSRLPASIKTRLFPRYCNVTLYAHSSRHHFD